MKKKLFKKIIKHCKQNVSELQKKNEFLTKVNEQQITKPELNDGLSKATKALDEMGIKYLIDEKDGLLIVYELQLKDLTAYEQLHKDFDCNDVTHYIKKILSGNLDIGNQGKKIDFKSKKIDFSNLEYFGGNLKVDQLDISLEKLKIVEGDFIARLYPPDMEYGYPQNIEKIGGHANIYPYVDMPKLTQIGKGAKFNRCTRVNVPSLESIGGHLDIEYSHNICLDNLKSLEGYAYVGNSKEAYNALGECKNKVRWIPDNV